MKLSWVAGLLALLVPFPVTVAQDFDGAVSQRGILRQEAFAISTTFDGEGLQRVIVVAGQPYSAERVLEHTQTLTNGTHINQKREMSHQYRDSAGRTRIEMQPFAASALPAAMKNGIPQSVHIYDAVAGYSYTLDVQNHIAHRFAVATPSTGKPPAPETGVTSLADAKPFRKLLLGRTMKEEPLGTEMIDGVEAVGTRTTVTTAAGVEGNDHPLKRVCEHWRSEEMKLTILSKCSDPRTGETITRLEKLDRGEPDPTLFQVPADYTVVEETDQFRIKMGTPETSRER
jgi:hypothetical protein